MKKVIFLSALFLTTLISFNSCKKNGTPETVNSGPERFSTNEARDWFTKNGTKKQHTSASWFSNFTVLWNTAKAAEDDNYYIMECDLSFDRSPGFFIGDSTAKATKTDAQINGDTRLVLLKNKKVNEIRGYLMNSYSIEMNKSKNSYTQVAKDFDGFVFFTDLDGNFVNGWEYQHGKIVRSTKAVQTKDSEHDDKAAFVAPVKECGWVEVQTYEQTCVYTNGVVTSCTQWQYVGSEYYYYCQNSGGGGGGGVDEELPAPPQLQITDNIVSIGTAYDATGNQRQRSYKWIFLKNAFLTFTSYDKSIQKKGSDGLWRFVSLTHDSEAMAGVQPGWEVSYSLKGITATPGEFWASIHFDCLVTSKTNFLGRVYASGETYSCAHYFNINDGN